jgi:hypothetical protein
VQQAVQMKRGQFDEEKFQPIIFQKDRLVVSHSCIFNAEHQFVNLLFFFSENLHLSAGPVFGWIVLALSLKQ